MSDLKDLMKKVVAEVMGEGISNKLLALYVEMVEELIDDERKTMPSQYGYTREKSLRGRCRRACEGYWAAGDLVAAVLDRFGKKGGGLIEYKGSQWIAQTRQWWLYELHYSRHEYDRALRIAKERELLDTAYAKLTPKGLPITLVRPTWKALLLRASLIASVKEAKAAKANIAEMKVKQMTVKESAT